MPQRGPNVGTPLSRAFYAAYRQSGLTFEEVANRASEAGSERISRSTAWAYIHGTRGGSQGRSEAVIRQLAVALSLDPDETVRLAGSRLPSDAERAIRNEPGISRSQKEVLINQLRRMKGDD